MPQPFGRIAAEWKKAESGPREGGRIRLGCLLRFCFRRSR
ncbi:hypothetical protein B8V81_1500 [Paenibacillus pasadenensis]|uniref:Uncharacterized protein n=1 Tax=Paenibacillus pasadenensis TaxID=217090 RepID=A0A2N5NA92_9BACL|nr:hypothetical protein B8V81_1500 [Paenibacillus pasadenensis]